MRIEHLKEFIVFARVLNVSRVAAKLNLSQSTLSRHLLQMERDLGFPLLDRDGGMELTAAAMSFLSDAEHIVRTYDTAVERCIPLALKTQQTLFVQEYGGHPNVSSQLSSLVSRLSGRDELIDIEWRKFSGYDVTEGLLDGTLDVAQTVIHESRFDTDREAFESKGVEVYELYREGIVYWMRADDPLAQKGSAALTELIDHAIAMPWGKTFNPMRDAVNDLYCSRHLTPAFVYGKTCSISEMSLGALEHAACVLPTGSQEDAVLRQRSDMAFVEVTDVAAEFVTCILLRVKDTRRSVSAFRELLVSEISPVE